MPAAALVASASLGQLSLACGRTVVMVEEGNANADALSQWYCRDFHRLKTTPIPPFTRSRRSRRLKTPAHRSSSPSPGSSSMPDSAPLSS